ncbi:Asp23/Gls24 family envelope stress response protein [Bacillus sp. 165]|uniref:Asp23/Gls24 family envelope stress response protein n=1 Tax=Bacillus sp. 165 TaxID=1529117 RepID=UPI001ADB504C|nr:Asp23/Gls24 family envelope stress response protein [Bacillus sp. 165]MBO9130294.1 Asp23/Gls24 family envelope stress response protein [Bacillus sp. 165]
MEFQQLLPYGSLYITKVTVHDLVQMCISEIDGVAKTILNFSEKVTSVIDRRTYKGVGIEHEQGTLSINVKVALYHTASIFATCYKIQEHIKAEIEKLTGLEVKEVNVKVEQIIKVHLD